MMEQDREISEVMAEERPRLRSFIRRRVPNEEDVEDILQEILYELTVARRLLMPIEYVTGWLFGVARNRITDLFRKKRPENFSDAAGMDDEGELLAMEEQRDVFVAHEFDGRSFKELAAETGVGVNTLLSRKRYAVLHLRERLRAIHDEFREK
jgi:DNA-directed RNA polymerase specialized sigma24 family protein